MMPSHRPLTTLLAALVLSAGLFGPSPAPARAAVALPPVPATWPSTRLELGLADAPGGAAALRASAKFGFRYQYLAGGVNTGNGWATWNTDGAFVTSYIAESVAHGITPVFPYYMLLQSSPAVGADEAAKDLSNLADTATMAAFYADLRLFFARAAGSSPVVLHVEPDLWGYIEQGASRTDDATSVPASVASSGDPALAGLPNTAAGFARAIVRLRDTLAPNVILAYHLSVWGTNHDISYSNDSDPAVDALAARAAAFYASLGASFDIAFTDIGDRDAAFKTANYGDNGASWWDGADFVRYARFIAGFVAATGKRMVVWQIPLGNTKMRAQDDTWGHYQDNRVEWFLDDPTGTHLALWRDAGVVALLFGGGAGGTTCACDAIGDGVTDPAAINGNARASLSADDDGGYFRERAAAYDASGGLTLGTGPNPPPPPPPVAKWTSSGSARPTSLVRGHTVTFAVRVKPSVTVRARVQVDVYDSARHRVYTHRYGFYTFLAGATTTYKPGFKVSATGRAGTYTVRIVIISTTGAVIGSNTKLTTFKVRTK
ncbi:MAG TPA: hypothetical protein VF323_07755 [Candidatus Limnocylindrales bacterium]